MEWIKKLHCARGVYGYQNTDIKHMQISINVHFVYLRDGNWFKMPHDL